MYTRPNRKRKAILAFSHGGHPSDSILFHEFVELARTSGMEVAGHISQRKKSSELIFGSGKIKELQNLIKEKQPELVIFNHALTGVQARNLKNTLQTHIIERTQLILKIFSDRARSYAGRLQVELAQCLDELPRVRGAWLGSLSRQGGGMGTRGPGEQAKETDRRQIQRRIRILRRKLKSLRQTRCQHRKLRQKSDARSFALIGYTNSGKSTLLNRLTRSQIPSADRLFLTLDPTTRKMFIPGLSNAVLTDTVGFIQDLPPHLIEAFQATLEESLFANVLLHVIDASHPNRNQQMEVVHSFIQSFGWSHKPVIHVYNKMDQVSFEKTLDIPSSEFQVFVSATSGEGISDLLSTMKQAYLTIHKPQVLTNGIRTLIS